MYIRIKKYTYWHLQQFSGHLTIVVGAQGMVLLQSVWFIYCKYHIQYVLAVSTVAG